MDVVRCIFFYGHLISSNSTKVTTIVKPQKQSVFLQCFQICVLDRVRSVGRKSKRQARVSFVLFPYCKAFAEILLKSGRIVTVAGRKIGHEVLQRVIRKSYFHLGKPITVMPSTARIPTLSTTAAPSPGKKYLVCEKLCERRQQEGKALGEIHIIEGSCSAFDHFCGSVFYKKRRCWLCCIKNR